MDVYPRLGRPNDPLRLSSNQLNRFSSDRRCFQRLAAMATSFTCRDSVAIPRPFSKQKQLNLVLLIIDSKAIKFRIHYGFREQIGDPFQRNCGFKVKRGHNGSNLKCHPRFILTQPEHDFLGGEMRQVLLSATMHDDFSFVINHKGRSRSDQRKHDVLSTTLPTQLIHYSLWISCIAGLNLNNWFSTRASVILLRLLGFQTMVFVSMQQGCWATTPA